VLLGVQEATDPRRGTAPQNLGNQLFRLGRSPARGLQVRLGCVQEALELPACRRRRPDTSPSCRHAPLDEAARGAVSHDDVANAVVDWLAAHVTDMDLPARDYLRHDTGVDRNQPDPLEAHRM
jgi:hypothetical protein